LNKAIVADQISKKFLLPFEKKESFRELFFSALKPQKYDEISVLSSISFEVFKGEFFSIIGKNGSGKSTLLKLLANIYAPDTGKVFVLGRISPFLELGVGFNPELSAFENVFLNGAVLGLSRKEIFKRYDEIVDFAELSGFMNQKLKNFSSGMQVRLAFSIAMQSDADVFLMDEVLAVGDLDFQKKCFYKFKELKKDGKTIVFVSHDLENVRRFSDRVLYLKEGKIDLLGETSTVLNKYVSDMSSGFIENDQKKPTNVVKLKFVRANLSGTMTLSEENSLKLKISLDSEIDYINPTLGFILYNSDGVKVFYSNSKISGLKVPDLKIGENEYLIELSNLNLSTGKYFLTLALSDEELISDFFWKDKAFEFYVENPSKGLGVCNFEHKFL
jgi:ABC-type polysaccharide/polyol phosphate transport system ATPase subunit